MSLSLGELLLSLRIDPTAYYQQLEKARQAAVRSGKDIEKSLLLQTKVDDKSLTDLNKHLDVKQQHWVETRRLFANQPIKPKVDDRELTKLNKTLDQLGKRKVSPFVDVETSQPHTVNQVEQPQNKKPKPQSVKVKVDTSLIGGLKTGLIEGLGQAFSLRAGSGVVKGFEKSLAVNLEQAGQAVGQRYARLGANAANNFAKGFGLEDGLQPVTAEFDQVLAKWENLAEGSALSIAQAMKNALLGNMQEAKAEAIKIGKDVANATLDAAFAPVRVRKREVAKGAARSAQNRAKDVAVDRNQAVEEAKSITIATGGLNFQPGGVENTNFIADLLKPILPESYIVGVANPRTNDPEGLATNFNDFARNLLASTGRDPGDLDVRNLGKLLEMAVVEGINPDAITMAATAAAYNQAYPDKAINLVGTSGGGHVAADAVHLLELMGVDTKGVGITTPFSGLASVTDPKKFRAQIGTKDPLYDRMFGADVFRPGEVQDVFEGKGQAHLLPKFIGEPEVQVAIAEFFGDAIGSISPDATGRNMGFYSKRAQDAGNLRGAIASVQGRTDLPSWFFSESNPLGRIEDLRGFAKALEDGQRKLKGSVKQESEEFVQFLNGFADDLELFFASGKQAVPDLSKAKQYFPDVVEDLPKQQIYTEASREAALKDFRFRGKTLAETDNFRRTIGALRGETQHGYNFASQPDSLRGLSHHLRDLSAETTDAQSEVVAKQEEFVAELQALIDRYQEIGIEPTAWELDEIESKLDALESELQQPMAQNLEVDQAAMAKAKAKKAALIAAEMAKAKATDVADSAKQKAFQVAFQAKEKAAEMAESGAVSVVNKKLQDTPGFYDQQSGHAVQITKLSDMSPLDYARVAAADTGKLLRGGAQGAGKMLSAAKTAEDLVIGGNPVLQFGKSTIQAIGGYFALGQIPMVGPAIQAGAGQLAHTGVDATIGAAQAYAGDMIAQAPMAVQIAMKPLSIAVEWGADAVAAPILEAAAAVMIGGKAVSLPANVGVKMITSGNSQVKRETQEALAKIKDAVQEANLLKGARPEEAKYLAQSANDSLKELGSKIDSEFAQIEPAERMQSDAAELRNLKAEVARLEQKTNAVADFFGRMREGMQAGLGQPDVIDIEATTVRPLVALPGAKLGAKDVETNTVQRVKSLKQEIATQTKLVKAGDRNATPVALELKQAISQTRAELDKIMAAVGKEASADLKNSVKALRSQMTRSQKVVDAQVAGAGIAEDVAAGMNAGLAGKLKELSQSGEQLARAVIQSTQDELEIKSPSRVFVRIGQFIVQGLEKGLDEIESMEIGKKLEPAIQEVKETTKGLAPSFFDLAGLGVRAFNMLPGPIKMAAGALLAFAPAQQIIGWMKDFASASAQAALEMQRLERVINFTSGSSQKGAENIAILSQNADRLGLDLRSSISGYAQFSASTKETPLEGDRSMRIFQGVSQASANYGLNPQAQERVFLALSQMASKGVVSMEELRQQLGESLPGALNVAARSMGMTTKEFSKMVERGEVLSSDFLPKFAQQLSAESATGASGAANSAQASFNRLNNSIFKLQATVGKGVLFAQKMGADAAVLGLDKLVHVLEFLIKILPAVGAVFAGKFIGSLAMGKAVIPFILTKLAALGPTLLKLLPTIAAFAVKFMIFQTITDVIGMFWKATRDQGGSFRDGAKQMTESIKQYQLALDNARKSQEGFKATMPQVDRDLKGESLAEGTMVGGIAKLIAGDAGTDFVRWAESGIQKQLGLRTFAQKQADDRAMAMNDLIGQRGQMRLNVAQQTSGPNSELAQMRKIDQQLEALQAKRRALAVTNPQDTEGRRAFKRQEEELLKQRETLSKPIGALQQANAQEIETYKDAIKNLNQLASEGKITQSEYNEKLQAFQAALDGAEKDQEKLNKALKTSVNSLEMFERAWSKIVDRLADTNLAIQRTNDLTRKTIAQTELAGGTEGSSNRAAEILQQEQLQQKIQATRNAIQQMRAELAVQDIETVKLNFGVTDETGANELKTLADRATGPKEKALLGRLSELKQLEGEVVGFEADLAEAQVAAKRRLRDLSKQVQEFYRGIERQAQEAALDAKSIQREIAGNNAKAKLRSALKGFQDNYVSEFVDSLISLVDSLNEPFKMAIEANKQIMQRQNQLSDTMRQAQELGRQLPTGYEGMGLSAGQVNIGLGGDAQNDLRQRIVNNARQWVGKDFRPGVEAQCQEFVNYVLNATENNLAEQIGTTKQAVDRLDSGRALASRFFGKDKSKVFRDASKARAGDIVAFGGTYGGYGKDTITHVGIYAGNGQIIDRPTKSGPVKMRSLDTFGKGNYWFARPHEIAKRDRPVNQTLPSPRSLAQGAGIMPQGINAKQLGYARIIEREGRVKGLNQNQIAAMIASAMQESTLGMAKDEVGGYGGKGLFQLTDAAGQSGTWIGKGGIRSIQDYYDPVKNTRALMTDYAFDDWKRRSAGLDPERAATMFAKMVLRPYSVGDKYAARARALFPGGRVASGGPAPGMMMPTTGMSQGKVEQYEFDAKQFQGLRGQVDQATALAQQTTNAEIERIKKLTESQITLKQAENLQQLRKAQRQLIVGGREQSRGNRGVVEGLEDVERSLGDDTALKSLRNDIAAKRREARDYKERLSDAIEKTQSSLIDAESLIQLIESGQMPEQFNQFLPELKKQRDSIQGQLKKLQDTDAKVDQTFGKAVADVQRKYNLDLYARQFESGQALSAAQIKSARAEAEQIRTRIELPFTTPDDKKVGQLRAAKLDRYAGLSEAQNETAQRKEELRKLQISQPDVYTPERVAQEVKLLDEALKRRNSAIESQYQKTIKDIDHDLVVKELERARESMRRDIEQMREQARDLQVQAKDDQLLRSDPIKALDLQQQALQKNFQADSQDAQLQIEEFNQQQDELVRSSQRTKRAAEEAKTQFEALNQVKLANLKSELEQNTAELQRQRQEIEYQSQARVFESAQQFGGLQVQKLREFDGKGIGAIDLQQKLDLERLDFDLKAKLRDIDLDKSLLPEAKQKLREDLQKSFDLQSTDITIKADLAREENDFQAKTLQFQSAMQINNARGNYARTFGFESQARDFEKQAAIAQENYNLADGLRKIDEQARQLGLAPEVVERLKGELESLNQINLQNINAQFNPLVEGLKGVKGAFQGFMGDIISGNESIGDAFDKMVGNILNSLSSLAAQLITEQLFGSIFGLGKGAGGGGIGGIFGSIFGFSEGGDVPALDHSDLRQRPDAVGQALRKEGPNSVLAALTPGERVLSVPERMRFDALGLGKLVAPNANAAMGMAMRSERMGRIYNFSAGGVVPGGPVVQPGAAQNLSNTNINIPIDIKGEGGEGAGGINAQRLRDMIRSVVIQELRQQKRPRGELF